MPLMEAAGTRVDRMSPDRVKNSIAPERSWLSMSVSEPSWLLGKIWISTRPLVSCLMRSIASTARTLSGCAVGELLAYLSWNSGAAFATHGAASVALTAVPASSTERRGGLRGLAVFRLVFLAFCRGAGFFHWRVARAARGGAVKKN